MATNLAIMGNMHIGHNPVVIANTGNPYILDCARVNGDILSYGIIVANFQSCGFASIFFVLGNTANRTKSVKLIVLADIRMAINYAMWSNTGTCVNAYVITNNTISTHLYSGMQLGSRCIQSGFMRS